MNRGIRLTRCGVRRRDRRRDFPQGKSLLTATTPRYHAVEQQQYLSWNPQELSCRKVLCTSLATLVSRVAAFPACACAHSAVYEPAPLEEPQRRHGWRRKEIVRADSAWQLPVTSRTPVRSTAQGCRLVPALREPAHQREHSAASALEAAVTVREDWLASPP